MIFADATVQWVIVGGTDIEELLLQEVGPMTVSDQDLTPALTRLFALLADTPPMDDFLTRAVRVAADVIAPAVAGGITTRRDHHPITVVASDPFAARVDELQYGAVEGPCLEALETGQVLQIDDMAAETRWDRYRPHAIAHGVVSSLSLPLIVGERTVAVLNLYARTSAAFAGQARRHGEAFAAQCSAALVVAWRLADQADLQQQLIEAMASRSVIDQALGILMAQQRCSADEAFDLLRTASQHRNRKLHDVAADIVTKVSGHPVAPGGFRLPRER